MEEVAAGSHDNKWQVRDGLVMVVGRVFVDALSPSIPAILADAHKMGHEDVAKSLH
jgi:hypothetical protein